MKKLTGILLAVCMTASLLIGWSESSESEYTDDREPERNRSDGD